MSSSTKQMPIIPLPQSFTDALFVTKNQVQNESKMVNLSDMKKVTL